MKRLREEHTHMEWVLMGYRVLYDAKPIGKDSQGEPLYSANDVERDDEDMP